MLLQYKCVFIRRRRDVMLRQLGMCSVIAALMSAHTASASEVLVSQVEARVGALQTEITAGLAPLLEITQNHLPALSQHPLPSGNGASIIQLGYHNSATISQTGTNGAAAISQLGAFNHAQITQSGH
jgi:hypothetical protein